MENNLTADTLGNLPRGSVLWAHCTPCGRSAELDIQVLIARLGPDFRVNGLRDHLRCSQCGGRAIFRRGYDGAGGYHAGGKNAESNDA